MNTYHITFGTYGTRLHGGVEPTVHHERNRLGDDFEPENEAIRTFERNSLKATPSLLSTEQRLFLEKAIPAICERGNWKRHIEAAREYHVHVLLSAEADPKAVRKWLKSWLCQSLNEHFGKRSWFAEGGSGKWVNDDDYFNAVYQYILNQRTTNDG